MPAAWQQDVAVEQKAKPPSCSFQRLNQKRVFGSPEGLDLTMEVHGNEEDAV